MRQALAIVAVVLVALLLWTAWRVEGLARDAERASRAEPVASPAPRAAAPAPEAPASASAPAVPSLATVSPATSLAPLGSSPSIEDVDRRTKALEDAVKDLSAMQAEWLEARMRANEVAAIATSRNAISAQAQYQMSAKADADQDGTGEYGGFVEMSGAAPGRMAKALVPPVLSSAFRTLTAYGEATRSGYLYRIYLPDSRGRGAGEPADGFAGALVHADLSETTWCMYAWPLTYGVTGTKTFFTNQGGDVLATEAAAYSGSGNGPSADAAFKSPGTITGTVAIGAPGADGNVWKQVN